MFPFGLTRAGGAYLAFVLLVSLAAVRAGSNALYALLAVTLSAIVISGIVSRNTLKQLALTLQTPDRIFAGKTVTTRVSLTNTKRLFPSMAIFVGEMNPGSKTVPEKQRRTVFFPILRAGETRSARLEQTFTRRGHRRQTLQVVTRFPFGLFQRRDPLPTQELLVYPAIGEIPEHLQADVQQGRRESRLRGSGENFYSIREYHEGESARVIDWKATAKSQKLMAREYAREDEINCLLILDTYYRVKSGFSDESFKDSSENPDFTEHNTTSREILEQMNIENKDQADESFEKAVSLAAGFAAYFIKKGAALEFLTPEVHIPSGSGESHQYRILEALAIVRRQAEVKLFQSAGQAERKPAVDLQKLISNQAFSIILTPLTEENFPPAIRRFARIISFQNYDI